MIINIAYDFDREAQKELCARLVITDKAVKDIVLKYINSLDYCERQAWIKENAKHKEEITEDEL